MPIGAFRLNKLSAAVGGRTAQTISNPGGTLDTSIKKFGAGSVTSNNWAANSLYSTLTGYQQNDITVEGWFYFGGFGNSGLYPFGLWSDRTNTTYGLTLFYSATLGAKVITMTTSAGNRDFTLPSVLSTNTWYHIAFTRNSSNLCKLYIDGTASSNTYTDSGTIFSSNLNIGFNNNRNAQTLTMKIDEFRVSKTTRYTSNFTSSNSAFTNDANTLLLVHFDASTFTDDNA